jgi:hypothetical protein
MKMAHDHALTDVKRRQEYIKSREEALTRDQKAFDDQKAAFRKQEAEFEKVKPHAKLGEAIQTAMKELALAEDRAEKAAYSESDSFHPGGRRRGGWMMTPFGPMPTRG